MNATVTAPPPAADVIGSTDDATMPADSGLESLLTMAALHGVAADAATLTHQFGESFNAQSILLAARSLGLKAGLVRQDPTRLDKAPLPAIARLSDGRFFIVARYQGDTDDNAGTVLLQHAGAAPVVCSVAELLAQWTGELIFLTSQASYTGAMAKFDFSWFIPSVIKYRRLLGEVLLISLVLQLIGLATPLFFQVVMDKVLINHALQTLNVIALGLVCAVIFEAVLTGIRTYVFAMTSSKIDVELGARLFQHLLALPIAYFEARRVGDSVARVRELENIRAFLTGNAMSLVMDVLFSFVFLGVMLLYSPLLTLVVAASIPVYFVLSLVLTPILRARLNDKFNRSSENQSFLVETIGGIQTVKALAVEPRWQQKWEQQLAAYVAAGLSATNVGLLAGGGVTLTSKLVTAAIMWLGAGQVLDGQLSVGELVAFNMLANQLASPVLRLAQLWNDFQQVGISMARLGDILDTRTETVAQSSNMPAVLGAIAFDNISFRYRPDAPDIIRGLNLNIAPGEVIGIVGRSGSGKSTLTKLAQRLYLPDRGRVLVDGHDIAITDIAALRHQIGIVLQENVLFSRSIRDNIALHNPALPLDRVIAAARLAGAHEFICELPLGYDTKIGEHGAGLSGGQRQRIAIARALIGNPRILIFDEATSALDYESERIIQDNMRAICQGRTVLIIAHRLSAVRQADRIVVMERGQIAELGSHDELMLNAGGIYYHLFQLQSSAPVALRPEDAQAAATTRRSP
ncbi:type I secretion system permease/ATPase [Janthinobacterium sp. RB2R34]|uniref:type I secretion system permease/ATPase n=1 Tax=Janthinobacterium sp. RB2R34 TaxID=3424193 RepID=UPI003F1EBB3D